jgi:flagellar biosynthesis/type III secretory pathway protein FliH
MDGKPFYFDENIFDDENLNALSDEERAALPEFTREEVEAEKKKAYQAGFDAGKKEALNSIHQKTVQLLEKIQRDTSVLFAAEDDRNKKYELDAVLLTVKTLNKTFPLLMKQQGMAELEAKLRETLNSYAVPEKISIDVHPDAKSHLKSYVQEMENTLMKMIDFRENPALTLHECKISWAQGGLTLNHDSIVEKTLSTIIESLAENGINVHDEMEIVDNSNTSQNTNQVGESSHD